MQKVDTEKMAAFIAAQRKARGLTQKALAGELGVTDKAVSKWERGLSCPDITLLPKLAELLGATTSELLDGALTGGEAPAPEVERLVENTLAYADTATKERARRLPRIAQAVITVLCAVGIGTCFICDLAISSGLTWSLLVGAATLYFWLVAIPPVRWGRKKGVALSLAALCLGLLPFLYTVEGVLGLPGLVTPMGARVGAIGAVLLWACYLLFLKLPPLTAGGVTALVSIPFIWGINATVDLMLEGRYVVDVWDVLTIALLIVIGVSLLAAGRRRSR